MFSFQALNNSNSEHVYYIRAERDEFVLGLQMINPFHNYTTEELLIYDYRKIKQDPLIQVIANFLYRNYLSSLLRFF
jgi:hypothetical protein